MFVQLLSLTVSLTDITGVEARAGCSKFPQLTLLYSNPPNFGQTNPGSMFLVFSEALLFTWEYVQKHKPTSHLTLWHHSLTTAETLFPPLILHPATLMAENLAEAPQFVGREGEETPDAVSSASSRKDKQSDSIRQTDPQGNVGVELKDLKGSKEKTLKHKQNPSGEEGEPKGSTGCLSVIVDNSAGESSLVQQNPAQSDKFKPEVNRLSGEGDVQRSTDSPTSHDAASLRNSSDLLVYSHVGSSAGGTPRKVARQSVGSDRSVDHSPMHANSQTRVSGKGGSISSPSWERKATSEGSHAPLTPGRSRLRSVTRGDDSPDQSPAVPKFGDWDDTDPSTGEGYTQIFERVREEKHNETGKVPAMSYETSYSNGQKQFGNGNSKGCSCFPWGKR